MTDALDFSNKTVLITGSSRGIGRAAAELFCRHGANVVINGRTKENLERARHELEEHGYHVLAVQADVGNEKDAMRLVEATAERFGRIDVLVNNAGISQQKTLEEITNSDWRSMVETHMHGAFYVTRAVVPAMKKQGTGVIINVASQSVVSGGSSVHYASAKGGIVAFTRVLSGELGKYGIRVNAVMPGLIKTDMTSRFIKEHRDYKKIIDSTALGRVGLPEEVAGACLFLASDLASYITGEILAVNGGLPVSLYV